MVESAVSSTATYGWDVTAAIPGKAGGQAAGIRSPAFVKRQGFQAPRGGQRWPVQATLRVSSPRVRVSVAWAPAPAPGHPRRIAVQGWSSPPLAPH